MLEVNELVGEGFKATNDIISVNNGNPINTFNIGGPCVHTSNNYQSAFKMCYDYTLNGYDDWFLPTTEEMAFARNYSTILQDTTIDNSNYYWTCNSLKQDDSDSGLLVDKVYLSTYTPNYGFPVGDVPLFMTWGQSIPGTTLNADKNSTAYCVSIDPISGTSIPDGLHWRTLDYRYRYHNVRAMRRFTC